MESILIKGLQLIVALSLLVIIHEFGHYLFARIFGIRADRFYLFFNPKFSLVTYDPLTHKWSFFKRNTTEEEDLERAKLVKKRFDETGKASWRDTVYGIGWIPLGGYVSIGGMIDESMDKKQMEEPVHPTDFRSKPAWQRFFVMFGGVLFNFILAIIIYIGIAIHWGDSYVPYDKAYAGMEFCELGLDAGFQNGDVLLEVDGNKINSAEFNLFNALEAQSITVLRDGKDTVEVNLPENFILQLNDAGIKQFMAFRLPVVVKETMLNQPAEKAGLQSGDQIIAIDSVLTPSYSEFAPALVDNADKEVTLTVKRDNNTIFVKATPDENGKLGFMLTPLNEIYPVETVEYSFFAAIPKGIKDGTNQLVTYVGSLKYLFTKSGAQSVGGFGSIGALFPEKWSWYSFWQITAFLSVILAFMNILPIPALDGGHIVFVLGEMITRRKPSEKVLEYSQMIGLAFLVLLLVYANANDIYRFFIK